MQQSSSFRRSLKRGSRVLCLIADNHASKLALKLSKALLQPRDELQLVTVVLGEESLQYGSELLAPFLPADQQQQQGPTITPVVLLKGDERLADVISQYAKNSGADLLVVGSQNLCVDGTRGDPLPASGSFALRLVKTVRCCPVLVVKANSKGPYIRATSAALGLKVMVECCSTGRHMLTWLMDQMDAEKDSIFLAVTKAHDQGTGNLKETATRMLTNFSVQAGTNDFYTAQRLFKDAGATALPQAVEADAIDILAVQAPNCKQLPESLIDMLQAARTSVLVYNQKHEGGAAEAVTGSLVPAAAQAAT